MIKRGLQSLSVSLAVVFLIMLLLYVTTQIPDRPLICPASQLNDPSFFLPSLPMQANPLPQRDYPWGNDPDPDRANSEESRIGHPNAIGCFPGGQTPYGCQEMSGNVWEWVQSLYATSEDSPKEEYERLDGYGLRVMRGGSNYTKTIDVRCFSSGTSRATGATAGVFGSFVSHIYDLCSLWPLASDL